MHVTSTSIGMCVLLFLLTGMAGVPAAIAQEQPQEPERGGAVDKSIELARESLEGLQLPHGITLLPRKSSQDKYAFRFADGKFETDPFEESRKSPSSVEQYLNTMRQLPVDICYVQFSRGSFIAFSGRISDVGEHLLHELNDQELPRPEKVAMVLDEDPVPGAFADIQTGHCYLVETCDGKYALVRLLAASANGALIQWVYQPDGSRKFSIPPSALMLPGQEEAPDRTPKPAEDLSECVLPNDVVSLPERRSPKAASERGYIYNFADRKLHLDPFSAENKRPGSVREFYEIIRREQTGDIAYDSINNGSLTAFSGRARDMGNGFLWELNEKPLPRPEEIESKEERSGSGEGYSGVIEHLVEGHRYIVETVDGKFALVRLLAQKDRAGIFQWVYQPDGTRVFNIPKSEPIPPRIDAGRAKVETMVQGKGSGAEMAIEDPDKALTAGIEPALHREECLDLSNIEDAIELHVADRDHLIKALGVLLKQNDQKLSEVSADQYRRMAMSALALGNLRAFEATEILVSRIALPDPAERDDAGFQSVSAMALVGIGKPATHAILEVMQRIASGQLVAGKQSQPIFKVLEAQEQWTGSGDWSRQDRSVVAAFERRLEFKFFCSVLAEVEGKAVAEFLLKSEMAKDNDEGRGVYRKALGLIESGLPACGSLETGWQFLPNAQGELGKIQEAVASHLANRRKLIDMLLNVLKESTGKDSRQLAADQVKATGTAIRALGVLRASEATDMLLDNIAFMDWTKPSREIGLPDSAAALVSIGKPATRAILGRLKSAAGGKDETALQLVGTRELFLYSVVLSTVEGAAVAKFLLKSEMEKVEEENRGVYRKVLQYVRD